MAIIALVVLGIVQGLCEFLPISSSGHLVLLSYLFGIEDSLFVSILLHFATLLAVFVVMRKEIFYIIRHPFSEESMHLVIATIFTCIVAIILMPLITSSFEGRFLPIFFLLSGVILLFAGKKKNCQGQKLDYKRSIIIGIAQGFAIFPGLSRSGTTISAGLITKTDKEESAKFSFLISIPIILGSMLLESFKFVRAGEVLSVNVVGIILSFVVAFVVGLITIKGMLKLTKEVNFKWFAIYLFIISIISAIIIWW